MTGTIHRCPNQRPFTVFLIGCTRVHIRDVRFTDAALGARHDSVGRLRNVRFRDILCRSENGAYIGADAPGLISGVVLDGVRIELDRWAR